jgi:hypothetical protein
MKKTTLLFISAMFLASCSSNFRIKSADSQDIKKGEIQQVSKIAEYRVENKKTSGTYTGIYKSGRSAYYMDLAKEIAVGNAITNGKCDFLVHPLFDISVVGNQITCTAEGYPAFYTTFKTWTRMDSIPAGYVPVKTSSTNEKTPNRNVPKKKNRALKVLGIYVLTGIVISAIIGSASI